MKRKKINNGKKSGEMTGQSAAPDCILENAACEDVCGKFWLKTGMIPYVRGPTLI